MKINLTDEMIEMEPGPNLYFMGSIKDFELFLIIAMQLASKADTEILLNEAFKGLKVMNPDLKVVLKSQENGHTLSKVENKQVIMELDPSFWMQISKKISLLAQKPSHIYLEFDELDLREDCNIIMSSEW